MDRKKYCLDVSLVVIVGVFYWLGMGSGYLCFWLLLLDLMVVFGIFLSWFGLLKRSYC